MMSLSAIEFAKERSAAIKEYGGWKVLSMGTLHDGETGAVHVEDTRGDCGFIIQTFCGSHAGAISAAAHGYVALAPNPN
jgi:hypothetical protein